MSALPAHGPSPSSGHRAQPLLAKASGDVGIGQEAGRAVRRDEEHTAAPPSQTAPGPQEPHARSTPERLGALGLHRRAYRRCHHGSGTSGALNDAAGEKTPRDYGTTAACALRLGATKASTTCRPGKRQFCRAWSTRTNPMLGRSGKGPRCRGWVGAISPRHRGSVCAMDTMSVRIRTLSRNRRANCEVFSGRNAGKP